MASHWKKNRAKYQNKQTNKKKKTQTNQKTLKLKHWMYKLHLESSSQHHVQARIFLIIYGSFLSLNI